jgi:hypothetical protein
MQKAVFGVAGFIARLTGVEKQLKKYMSDDPKITNHRPPIGIRSTSSSEIRFSRRSMWSPAFVGDGQ